MLQVISKKLYIFGEGKLQEIAMQYDTPILAELPLDPAVASAVDAGNVEDIDGARVKTAVDVIERRLAK